MTNGCLIVLSLLSTVSSIGSQVASVRIPNTLLNRLPVHTGATLLNSLIPSDGCGAGLKHTL